MRSSIKIENFQPAAEQPFKLSNWKKGTAEVTILGKTRTLDALEMNDRDALQVYGVAVRVGRTGMKIWRGELTLWKQSGNISATRSGNFRNPHGSGITVVGFYDDATNICEHSSQFVAK